MTKIALFDMDKTLVRKDTAGLYIRYEYDIGRASIWRVARVFGWRMRYTLGWLPAEQIAQRVLGWYTGRDVTELRRENKQWARQYVFPHIGEMARSTVRQHQEAGDFVMMVTAQTRYAAEPVMEELGIEHLVASELEVQDGKISGRISWPLCYGPGKVERARDYLREYLGTDDLSGATVYTDSITDEPLLLAAGVPIAVNPDPRLLALAIEKGWTIQRW